MMIEARSESENKVEVVRFVIRFLFLACQLVGLLALQTVTGLADDDHNHHEKASAPLLELRKSSPLESAHHGRLLIKAHRVSELAN